MDAVVRTLQISRPVMKSILGADSLFIGQYYCVAYYSIHVCMIMIMINDRMTFLPFIDNPYVASW